MGGETISSNREPGTTEAEAFVDALNRSAERVQTLWFSFLTFMVYLAIATGTTTHRMLFLKDPLNLPVLNIALPLVAFYVLTPFIFVVFHFYMLLNLVLLARTAKTFEDALGRAFPDDGEPRENFRMRIENTLFVQLLVGGRLEREGLNAKLLSWMALITLALAPVALLLMIQIQFLPYHSEAITWLHRGLLALDLVIVWTLWPGYRRDWGKISWPKWGLAGKWTKVLSAAVLLYAVVIATFPDELMYVAMNWLRGSPYFDPTTGEVASWVGGDGSIFLIEPVNTLDVHGQDLIDDTKLGAIIGKNESSSGAHRWVATVPLAGRDLTGADLTYTDVRHVDFTGAILNRANLSHAWAEKSHFDHAQLQSAQLVAARLQSASFFAAHLQGATLVRAQLQGISLILDGQRSWYESAQLQGASLDGAQLQGASLDYAQLQGASLIHAQLQGASLNDVQLQGASLDGAQLQGASLDRAELQGATLTTMGRAITPYFSAHVTLTLAQLRGTSFVGVCTWRADARLTPWKDTRVTHANKCNWTAASFAALEKLIAEEVPGGYAARGAVARIEQRLNPEKALEGEDEMAKVWAAHESENPAPETYEKSLLDQWREVGCAEEGAPYVVHALIDRMSTSSRSPFRDQSDAAKALTEDFLDEAHCAGAHGLSEADKATLKKIAASAAPPAPKP